MIGIRHEEYVKNESSLPFIIHTDIFRDASNFSKEKNWHNDLEIQLCTSRNGTVLINGKAYSIAQNDIIIIEPDAIHYTGTSSALTYTCLIINPIFFSSIGIEIYNIQFEPLIKNQRITDLLDLLVKTNSNENTLKNARLNKILLEIVIEIIENHSVLPKKFYKPDKSFGTVKSVIKYIRKHYNKK